MVEPRKILWAERDAGQKLSMVLGAMFYLLIAGISAVMGVKAVLAGDWWWFVVPMCFLIWSAEILHRWKRRNAR